MDVRYYAYSARGSRTLLAAETIEEALERVKESYFLRKTTVRIAQVTTTIVEDFDVIGEDND